jgi:uncharacterized 2Fe-2S/4Fe-4S cluster protein (DUF4445 family)
MSDFQYLQPITKPPYLAARRGTSYFSSMPHTVTFLPSNKSGPVPPGTRISDAATLLGETGLHLECGGKGTCGGCLVDLVRGTVGNKGKTVNVPPGGSPVRLRACQCTVSGDAELFVVFGKAHEAQTMVLGKDITAIDPALLPSANDLSPVVETVSLRVKEPSAETDGTDLSRLEKALSEKSGRAEFRCGRDVLSSLPGALRSQGGLATVRIKREPGSPEIVSVNPGAAVEKNIGIACDIGTTTISLHCVDLATGAVLASKSDYNAQIRRGADVISRIEYAKNEKRLAEMRSLVLSTVNGLIDSALDELKIPADSVFNVAIAGNTTMMHLLLGLPPQAIRESPYVPVVNAPGVMTAAETGIHANPHAAVSFAPGVGSYVGGDITSGLLVTPMIDDAKNISLFMDIGTNGEIAIGNAEFLMAAACSAGPAFEGSGIKCGMRAATGAIESFETDPEMKNVKYGVIGAGKPKGICGSGLIAVLGELYAKGLIDRSGRIADRTPPARIARIDGTKGLVLVKSAAGYGAREIVVTEADIENLVRTKAAIYAACDLMLSNIGLTFESISHVYIAGGFGRFVDVEKAVRIGMLPDIPRDRFSYLGNSSLTGATMALVSKARRAQLAALAQKMTYIDLSSDNRYMDAYVAALFLPHTDLGRFPSMKQ